ncbi:MAG: hypothetical protein K2Q18_04330 [Bdellovibrionales bacterium]|nr:hypothetical protein [Bdellovibrionales bacterium]
MPKGGLILFGPPGINKDYFLFEWGFVTEKKIKTWDYKYNAYVTVTLFQDASGRNDNYKAGALGFKGGVFLPIQPWIPLLFSLNVGYAKTALHKDPFLGRDDSSLERKDMILAEAGLFYRIDNFILRYSYQYSNIKYFKRHLLFTVGVNY